jgi:hypothetical protein
MLMRHRLYLFAISSLTVLTMAGCGSGSDSSATSTAPPDTAPPSPPVSAAVVISGVAARGAPLDNATVNIQDQTGKSVGSGQTAADGSFSIKTDPSFKPPLVVTATASEATLVSMVDTRTSTTVNVNTVSNLVAALLSATGNPLTLSAELASGKVTFDEKVILANWSKVQSVLQPLLAGLKTEIADLRSGLAPANGTGPDLLLDTLDISITKNANNTSTIEITIKTAGDGQEMPVIRFTNSTLLEQILKSNGITATTIQNRTIQAANLPAPGTSAQIADLLKRMTDCFALPVGTRVSGPFGTVTAAQCRALFRNDDPATYLHFGAAVGPAGAFPGLFSEGGTGAGFGQGTFEYKRDNGDIEFSFVSVDRNLTSRREESVATMGSDGKLRLTGNRYRFAGSVNPMAETRDYMDGGLESLISTGYDIKVPLQEINDENIVRVDVTSPRGTKYSLIRGTASMTLPKLDSNFVPEVDDNGTIAHSSSAFVRLRVIPLQDFKVGGGKSSKGVSITTGERDLQLLRQPETDEVIASYPPRGMWTLEYFTGKSATPVARQTVRTRARAMSVEELSLNRSVDPSISYSLTPGSLAPLLDRLNNATAASGLFLPLQDLPSTFYAWSALADPSVKPLVPVSIRVLGTLLTPVSIPPFLDFVDSVDLRPDMREATVPCRFGSGVLHCDAQGRYMENTWLDGIQLLSRDGYGREFTEMTSTWRVVK